MLLFAQDEKIEQHSPTFKRAMSLLEGLGLARHLQATPCTPKDWWKTCSNQSKASKCLMGSTSRYWQLVRIDAAGQRKVEKLATAKAFFEQTFANCAEAIDVADEPVQQALLHLMQQHTDNAEAAGLCLRCFVSHEIEQECIRIERKFGEQHGFSRRDLYPFVLDDDGRRSLFSTGSKSYRPLAFEIIQTFAPQQAKLTTWTSRLVRTHRSLNQFLRECGVYLESDWSILSQMKREQLQRILTEFHALSRVEVERSADLLQAYHLVYRQDRLRLRQQGMIKGKERCLPPTPDQLMRMAKMLQEQAQMNLPSEVLLSKLQTLATQVRQYRLAILPTQSIDQPEHPIDVAAPEPDEAEAEQQAFLKFYQEQMIACLDEAMAVVTGDRLTYLQRKKPQNVEIYLKALHLFHCRGQSMGAIARALSLRAQDTVTRLLELKNFRANIRQQLLIRLCERVLDKAKIYASATRLQTLDQQIELALEEQIATLMQQAENEATVARDRPLASLFARRLCLYLDDYIQKYEAN